MKESDVKLKRSAWLLRREMKKKIHIFLPIILLNSSKSIDLKKFLFIFAFSYTFNQLSQKNTEFHENTNKFFY